MITNRRSNWKLTLLLVAGLGMLSTAALAAPVEINFPFEVPAQHIKGKTIQKFADVLESSTDGYYDVKLYPAGQLMSPSEEIAAVARKQIQMAAPFLNYFSGVEPGFTLYNLPFLFNDYDALGAVTGGEVGKELLGRLESPNLVGLNYWFEAPNQLFTKTPVEKLEDVAGMKLRVFPSEIMTKTTEALHATPTAIPGPEIYLALQQGVADGAITTPTYAVTINLPEVQSAMTKLAFSFGGYAVIINKPFWDEQPPKMQQAIRDAVAAAADYNKKQVLKDLAETDMKLETGGMRIIEVEDAEKARWRDAVKPVYESLDSDLKDLANRARAEANGK